MNNWTSFILAVAVASCTAAQEQLPTNEWKAKLKVLDESSQPVTAAEVWISYLVPPAEGETIASERISGLTDTNGLFTASHRDLSYYLGFHAQKHGYYPSKLQYELGYSFQYDPVKWTPNVTLTLKSIRKPIPMFVKRIRSQPPVSEKAVGYDVEVGDWVAPFGKGKNGDIIFAAHHDRRSEYDWDYNLVVSFPNPGDGIKPFTISETEKTSSLRSPHEAPANGYQSTWIKQQSQRPGLPSAYGIDKNLNFFFRVRTVLDEKGSVKTAHYGKIYGDFMDFEYFFNPEVNSRNVEFDPTKNLMKNLDPSEHVTVP